MSAKTGTPNRSPIGGRAPTSQVGARSSSSNSVSSPGFRSVSRSRAAASRSRWSLGLDGDERPPTVGAADRQGLGEDVRVEPFGPGCFEGRKGQGVFMQVVGHPVGAQPVEHGAHRHVHGHRGRRHRQHRVGAQQHHGLLWARWVGPFPAGAAPDRRQPARGRRSATVPSVTFRPCRLEGRRPTMRRCLSVTGRRAATPPRRAAEPWSRRLPRPASAMPFTVPGESFLGVLDALHDAPIRTIATRHEAGAGFMAEAVGQLTGRPRRLPWPRARWGPATCPSPLHTARQDSTPLVAIVGQVPRAFRGREAFQEVDLVATFGALVQGGRGGRRPRAAGHGETARLVAPCPRGPARPLCSSPCPRTSWRRWWATCLGRRSAPRTPKRPQPSTSEVDAVLAALARGRGPGDHRRRCGLVGAPLPSMPRKPSFSLIFFFFLCRGRGDAGRGRMATARCLPPTTIASTWA